MTLRRRLLAFRNSARPAPELALMLDLIAACLAAGAPPELAIRTVDNAVTTTAGLADVMAPLRKVGRLLELGSSPEDAWRQLPHRPGYSELATSARRCATSGSKLAGALRSTAKELRAEHHAAAIRRAERTGVLCLLPLGLCFLPAFVAIGITPIVVGVGRQIVTASPAVIAVGNQAERTEHHYTQSSQWLRTVTAG